MASADADIGGAHVPPRAVPRASPAQVVHLARELWSALTDPSREPRASHAVCVKLYQLHKASGDDRYERAMLDEAHDCSAVQLSSFLLLPHAEKLCVFDPGQSINQFRRALPASALAALPCVHEQHLSQTRRYGEPLASHAQMLLHYYKGERATTVRIVACPGRVTFVRRCERLPLDALPLAVISTKNLDLVVEASELLARVAFPATTHRTPYRPTQEPPC